MNLFKGKIDVLIKYINKFKLNNRFNLRKLNSVGIKLVASFLIMIIPMIALGIISQKKTYAVVKRDTESSITQNMRQSDKYLKSTFENVENIAKQIYTSIQFQDLYTNIDSLDAFSLVTKKTQLVKNLQTYQSNNKIISSLLFVFKPGSSSISKGSYVETNNKNDKLSYANVSKYTWFKEIKKNGIVPVGWIGEHKELDSFGDKSIGYYDTLKKGEYISFVREVTLVNVERSKGLMIIDLSLKPIYELLKDINYGENSQVHLITSDLKDIGFKVDLKADKKESVPTKLNMKSNPWIKEILKSKTVFSNKTIKFNNENNMVIYNKVGNTGITLLSMIPEKNLSKSSDEITNTTIILVIIGIIVAVLIGGMMSLDTVNVLKKAINITDKIANGDLTVEIEEKRQDEFGKLLFSISNMALKIKTLITKTSEISAKVYESSDVMVKIMAESSFVSNEITKTIQEISTGAISQTELVNTGTSSMKELSEKIIDVDQNTSSITSVTNETKKLIKVGFSSLSDLKKKSMETSNRTTEILNYIQDMNNNSKTINKIIRILENISTQTNLLSLNAAIEASKAGEFGKGFSVVADEIKKLAQRSNDETSEIDQIVKSIQDRTTVAVQSAEKTKVILIEQNLAVTSMLDVFENITIVTENLIKYVSNITSNIKRIEVTREKTSGIINNISLISEESTLSIEDVTASTQEQLANIQKIESYAADLKNAVHSLVEIIKIFKI